MVSIYIGATAGYSGKSLVSMGLGLRMKQDGFNVGYMKPFGRVPTIEGGTLTDGDALFMKKTLELTDALEDICPVVYTHDLMTEALRGKGRDVFAKVKAAYSRLAKGRDALILGGAKDFYDGSSIGVPATKLIKEFESKVVVVDPFDGDFCVDCLLSVKELIGESLIGAVINKVPPDGVEYMRKTAGPFLKKKGIPLLGVLPVDKVLNSITIRQLNESLGGRVLCSHDRLDEFVENFSIGAMDVESALKYFRRTPNKAVVTGGHRSDIQLAALETSTKCLVLTGDLLPNDLILGKAQMAGVPIISVKHDTLSTVERFEAILGRARIREERKVSRAASLMQDNFDFDTFYARAGLKRR